jgi:hypothetical protein
MATWLWENVFPYTFWASLLRPGNWTDTKGS